MDTKIQAVPLSLPAFRVWICGPFLLERGDGTAVPVKDWGGSQDARRLLRKLIASPGRCARRDELIEALWPEREPDEANRLLSDAVYQLRKVLKPTPQAESLLLAPDKSGYRLPGQDQLWVDADAALELLTQVEQRGRSSAPALPFLREAVAYLNRGPFLEEEEGQWATGRRATLERAHYRSRLWLVEAYAQQGMPGQAETVLGLLLEEDPTDDDVLCCLMLLLHQQGMTHQALRFYEHMCQVFAMEGMELAKETRALAERLRQERWFSSITYLGIEEGITFFPSPFSLTHHAQNALLGQTPILEEQSELQPSRRMVQFPGGGVEGHSTVQPTGEKIAPLSTHLRSSVRDLFGVGIQALFLVGQQECWSADEMNIVFDQVLKKYSDMTLEEQKEKAISRRDVLMLLTGMSGALLGLSGAENTPPLLVEEALSLCLTTIPACWSLVYAGGIEHIEQVLPQCLTRLTAIAQQSSRHRQLAATLASQGYKLANLLDLQREDFISALKHSKDALIYGQLAGDLNLQLAALIEEALTFQYHKRPLQTLETYQRALQLIPRRGQASGIHNMVSPIIAGRVYVGLAVVHAQLEQEQEALQYIGLAQDTFPDYPENDPHFAYTHYDDYYLYLYQGLMYMKLNQPEQALSAYAHFNAPKYAPRRMEIANKTAVALLASGDMDQCYDKVEAAVALAVSMDSDLRYSEAQEVYQGMLIKWPRERKVKSLAQVFQR